jgi:DNA-binding transcriptional LysR family regulator
MPEAVGFEPCSSGHATRACLATDIVIEASSPETVAELARRGLGVGILSQSMTADADASLAAVVIFDVDTPAVLALVWRPSPNPPLRELVGCCVSALAPGS